MGRAFEVLDMIKRQETAAGRELTPTEIVEVWSSKVQQANLGDQVTVSYVEALLQCKRRVFSDGDVTKKLLAAEETFGTKTPWDSIYKVAVLASKVGKLQGAVCKEKLVWMVDFVHDRVQSELVERGDLSVRALSGKGAAGNKGVLDLALLKMELCQHTLGVVLANLPGDGSGKDQMRAHSESFAAYRAAFGFPNDEQVRANPWLSLLPLHLQKFYDLHRELVFGSRYDAAIKGAMRAGRSAEECLEESGISQHMEEINDLVKRLKDDLKREKSDQDKNGASSVGCLTHMGQHTPESCREMPC